MKQILIILVLSLGMCSINVSAQTKKQSTAKRTTTAHSTNSQQGGQVMKFKQVGEDGYVWYKLKRGNLCGARDAEGNNIIPIKYDDVSYVSKVIKYAHNTGSYLDSSQDGVHYFTVTKGKNQGVYSREGRLVVSTERNYERVWLSIDYIKPFWLIHVTGEADAVNTIFGNGLLDMKGNVVIPPKRYKYVSPFYCGVCVKDYNDKEGICDWNGNIVIPCQYKSCWLEYKDGKYKLTYYETENSEAKQKTISFDTSSRFDYQTYDNLVYNYDAPSSNSSSSSSTASSNSSSGNNNSGNKTTTVVVEHHRDPVPVQEWQQCTNCWGEGKVMCLGACGGTGTYYVGDRLHICNSCGGTGKKICPYCGGQGGKNVTVYR